MIANKLLTHNSKPQRHQTHLFPKQKHPNLTHNRPKPNPSSYKSCNVKCSHPITEQNHFK